MAAILLVSTERFSGKSTIAVGLALEFKDRGYKVGFMKPVGDYPMRVENQRVDEDAFYLKEALGLDDRLSDLSQFFLNWETLNRYMRKSPGGAGRKVKAAYERIAEGKDIVLLEGAQNFIHGKVLGLSSLEVSALLDARVVLLDTFNDELTVDRCIAGQDYFGERFLGVLLNWVPERRMQFAKNQLPRYLASRGIELLGAIPSDRVLRSVSVNDLASGVGGEIICARDRGDELVESMMVGAMSQEHSLRLFRKERNKVVITGADRSEIQLAALQTPTKCMVLTGGHPPSPIVVGQAEEMGVPIIMVDTDTATAVERVEVAIGRQRSHDPKKIERVRKYIKENVEVNLMLSRAGVKPRRKRAE